MDHMQVLPQSIGPLPIFHLFPGCVCAPARLRMDGRSEAPMKAYRVSGTAPFGSQRQHFSYDLPAADADAATHKVYSTLGSRHRHAPGHQDRKRE